MLLIGGYLVLNQKMNIGQFVAAEIVILLVINSVEKIIVGLETLYDVLTAVEKIGQIMGSNNSTEKLVYNYLDENPSEENLYRLKQIDLDGKFAYSKIISVKNIYDDNAKNKLFMSRYHNYDV